MWLKDNLANYAISLYDSDGIFLTRDIFKKRKNE